MPGGSLVVYAIELRRPEVALNPIATLASMSARQLPSRVDTRHSPVIGSGRDASLYRPKPVVKPHGALQFRHLEHPEHRLVAPPSDEAKSIQCCKSPQWPIEALPASAPSDP